MIDRSDSTYDKIPNLRSALEVFLKFLPIGIDFNIVSFGNKCRSLWRHSEICDRESLDQALKYTKEIKADMGGSEILSALKYAVGKRYQHKVPEILLLTDGLEWNQKDVFSFVGEAVKESSLRFFTLGIGSGVSHSFVGGIFRAGLGFSQSIQNYEELKKNGCANAKGYLDGAHDQCHLGHEPSRSRR